MSVDTKHELYLKGLNSWKLSRDVIAGDEAIKDAGEYYVPSLDGQDANEYKSYVGRPVFENFSARTLDGLTGLVFTKPPTLKASKKMLELQDRM